MISLRVADGQASRAGVMRQQGRRRDVEERKQKDANDVDRETQLDRLTCSILAGLVTMPRPGPGWATGGIVIHMVRGELRANRMSSLDYCLPLMSYRKCRYKAQITGVLDT